jgi:hypothetical protein
MPEYLISHASAKAIAASQSAHAREGRGAKEPPAAQRDTDIPPLLKKLLKDQSDSGLPPAYLPKDERPNDEGDAS